MTTQIYAVLMALENDSLLLPNVAISEVLPRVRVQAAAAGAPEWLVGNLDWNGRQVPVVSFEALNGGAPGAGGKRERVVILSSLGVHLPGGALGVLTQGYPHLVTLNEQAVKSAPLRDSDRAELVLARVRISNQEAAIPDLAMVEAAISRVTLLTTASAEPAAAW